MKSITGVITLCTIIALLYDNWKALALPCPIRVEMPKPQQEERVKIIHVTESGEIAGGREVYLAGLIPYLQREGHEVTVFYTRQHSGTNKPTLEGATGCRCVYVPPKDDSLRTAILHEEPDVVHLHNRATFGATPTLARSAAVVIFDHNYSLGCPSTLKYFRSSHEICRRKFGVGCISLAYTEFCNSRHPKHVLSSFWETYRALKGAKAAKALIVASHAVKRVLIQNGMEEAKIHVLPYFTKIPQLGEANKANQSNKILFVGRISGVKGVDYLLKALKSLGQRIDWQLDVVGSGYDFEKIRQMVKELQIAERVTFLGWISGNGLAVHYRNCAMVVVPSLWPEAFGIVGIEAMAYGKPVIAFNVGGISVWLQDGQTGYLVPPYDIREMSERIEWLLKNPTLANKMGEAGRKEIKRRFLPEHHLKQLLGIYNDAISK